MPIILQKSVFVHIPKTGGTWVTAVLRKMNLIQITAGVHYPPSAFREFVGDRLYFTFVRNPVTWYQSKWTGKFARSNFPIKLKHQPGFHIADKKELNDFRYWLGNVLDRTSLTSLYQTYLGDNLDDCDFIGRTETLGQDLQTALTQAGEKVKPKFLNLRPRNESIPLDRHYTKPLLKKVIRDNMDVMVKFGYPTDWQTYSSLLRK